MRIRHKKRLPARMEAVSHVIAGEPEALAGQWRELLSPAAPELFVELGCGRGAYTCALAARRPGAMVVGVERVADALIAAAEKAHKDRLLNARFVAADAEGVTRWFNPCEIDRLIINFCDPWPHWKHAGRRLVAGRFLALYAPLLAPGGRLLFKTDNAPLFAFAQKELRSSGWSIGEISDDLPDDDENIMSDYEAKFRAAGVPIAFLSAAPPVP